MGNKLKVGLVNPRVESLGSMIPPLGLLWVAAVLEKHSYEVKIFDLYPYDDADIDALVQYRPDVVGMTLLTDYWTRAKHTAEIIRRELPDAMFVVGGVHATMAAEDTLKGLDASVVVIGEGEYTMLELCGHFSAGTNWGETRGIAYFAADGRLLETEPRGYIENLDELPFPARHLLDFDKYLIPPGIMRGYWSERGTVLMTSRGCPFQCVWCGTKCTFGLKVRRRSIDNVMEEIRALLRDYSLDTIYFLDDTFTLNRRWVMEFCDRLISEKINLKWGCQAHVETVEVDLLAKMVAAGLVQLDMGVESGSDKVLSALKKHSDIETIKKAFSIAKSAGVRTMASFVLGSPTETWEDIEATMKLAREIWPNYASAYFLTPYPGTELMAMAKENNWLINEDRAAGGLRKGPMMRINFTEKELFEIRARFQKMFVYRNVLSVIFSPQYFFRSALMAIRYPMGFVLGLQRYLKSRAIDDFFFVFYDYYLKKRTGKR